MEYLYVFISVALLLASYLFTTHLHGKFSNLPPTIFPTIPIIGHLHLLKPPLYRTFAKISAKYGPILLLRFGYRRVLLVSSPSAAEECFTENDIIFANRPQMLHGKIIGSNYTSIAWAPYGDNWRNLRRISAIEILSTHRLNGFHDIRVDECRLLIRKLLSNSSPVKVKSVLYEMMVNVMMRMISGKRYFGGDIPEVEKEGKRLREILDEAFRLSGARNPGDFIPFLGWLGEKGLEKKLIALQEKREMFFQGLIEQLRKLKGGEVENKKKTLIEVLLSLQESDPEYYTDKRIRCFLLDLLSAGVETSIQTMEWCLSLLLNDPQVLEKAWNEIDKHVGTSRVVNESDLPVLPYLRSVIYETLRMYPPAPLLLPHESSEDCSVGGYNVPNGTMLLVNVWGIQHDPNLWIDPERFNPERFEGVDGAKDGFKLMPFGTGRRRCPGEGLAMRVLGSTLGSLIQCFDWERMSEEMVDMTEAYGLSMPKAEPLVAKCKPRLVMQNLLSQM